MNQGRGRERVLRPGSSSCMCKAISGLSINIVKADLHRSKVDHVYWFIFIEYFVRCGTLI